jgi:hypothetical protein
VPIWKCPYFARKDSDEYFWGSPVENCGLCINWCDTLCIHHEKLKGQGDNDPGKENIYNDYLSNIDGEFNDRSGDG